MDVDDILAQAAMETEAAAAPEPPAVVAGALPDGDVAMDASGSAEAGGSDSEDLSDIEDWDAVKPIAVWSEDGVQPSQCLFFGCIPHMATEAQVAKHFAKRGTLQKWFFMADKVQSDRGWGMAIMSTPEEAALVIEKTNAKDLFPGAVRPFHCKFLHDKLTQLEDTVFEKTMRAVTPWQEFFTADGHPYYSNLISGETVWERPKEMDETPPSGAVEVTNTGGQGKDGLYGPPGSNLFVFNIPSTPQNTWDDDILRKHFEPYGKIMSARIQIDLNTGASKGFGFVSFATPTEAALAIKGMHGFTADVGRTLKVQLKRGEEHFAAALPNA